MPVHLDALLLAKPALVRNSIANYALLPYSDRIKDNNPDIPYLGEFVLNHPFQDKNLLLGTGVHLHWSLPIGLSKNVSIPIIRKSDLEELKVHFRRVMLGIRDVWTPTRDFIWDNLLIDTGWIKPLGKTRGSVLDIKTIDQVKFDMRVSELIPRFEDQRQVGLFVEALTKLLTRHINNDYQGVPNIWLVNRKKSGQIQKTWIVESNFIALTQSDNAGNPSAIAIPFHDDRHDNKSQPFRYMGRQIEGNSAWASGMLQEENYLQEITALGFNPQPGSKGFAEPTFAAFYPNCHSVFGLYDPEITTLSTDIGYEVLGIYGNPENDYLSIFINDFANRTPRDKDYFQKLNEALLGEFNWRMAADTPINDDRTTPKQALLYGKTFLKLPQKTSANQVQIAIGNTGTEALAAYIASQLPGNRQEIEDLLEAIQFTASLQNKVLDIGYKFQEARHDKGFTAFPGGSLWSIKLEPIKPQTASANNDTHEQELTLPDDIALLLNEINILQTEYERAKAEIIFLRRQLYADWYKYMVCTYPPMDQKTNFFDNDLLIDYIRNESIQPLTEKIHQQGVIHIAKDENGRFKSAQITGNTESVAGRLMKKLQELTAALQEQDEKKGSDGKSWKDKGKQFAIRTGAAPRYWRANDPVVLFVEKPAPGQLSILSNDRHDIPDEQNVVECKLLDNIVTDPANFSFDEARKLFIQVSSLYDKIKQTGDADEGGIWNPFILEWEVEYLPVFPGSNEASSNRQYEESYISQHYKLEEIKPDFTLTSSKNIIENSNIYRGSTILTPHAGIRLGEVIESFISNFKDRQSAETLKILDSARNFLKESSVLAQSLGGFHEALLLQRQTRQLDVADPLGFPEYQAFTEFEVAPLVGQFNLTAPDPYGVFNPIRCGFLKILNLRVVDNYGQTLDFEIPATINSDTLSLDEFPTQIHLNPRLTQPARLNFRFLSATAGEQEMNAHPASSPVCGWLVLNNLDNSILFYDQDGSALGALTMNAANPWLPAPDSTTTTFIDSIANLHLRKVARYLFEAQRQSIANTGTTDNSFLKHFLVALDTALENISPENFAEHQDLALLMGRPIAVVRAKLDLELQEPAFVDQSWTQLSHELQGHGRSSEGFTKVKFPFRLGDYRQANDGLLGYWIETPEGKLGDNYYSSEAGVNPDPLIVAYKESGEGVNIFHAIDDDPICVTMLVDPLGSIHVTSGILPVKSIHIPKDQYKNVLKHIAVTFLTAPVLSMENHLRINLPKEPGYGWTWLEKTTAKTWLEINQSVTISRALFDSKFPDIPGLWEQLVGLKWLQPLPAAPNQAMITTAVHRAYPPNETGDPNPFPIEVGKRLDNFFDAYGKRIEPFDVQVDFGGKQVIREGWLQLAEDPKEPDQAV